MDTDCFIQSLRRFIARRGNVRWIKCDNGTNFVGGKNELKHAESHGSSLRATNTIMSKLLSSILRNHETSLKNESLQTLVREVEAIVNHWNTQRSNQPDAFISSKPSDFENKVIMPPPGYLWSARYLQSTSMEKDSTSSKRILVEMEERILNYVTKPTKVERFEKKYRSWYFYEYES